MLCGLMAATHGGMLTMPPALKRCLQPLVSQALNDPDVIHAAIQFGEGEPNTILASYEDPWWLVRTAKPSGASGGLGLAARPKTTANQLIEMWKN